MAILALADQHPELFGRTIVGVGLLATTAWPVRPTLGLPRLAASAVRHLASPAVATLGRYVGPRTVAQLATMVTRSFAVAPTAQPALSSVIATMTSTLRPEVLAALLPQFAQHEKADTLPTLRRVHTLIMAGDQDLIIPSEHATAMAMCLPQANVPILPGVGHCLPLERPDLVSHHLAELLDTAETHHSDPAVTESSTQVS